MCLHAKTVNRLNQEPISWLNQSMEKLNKGGGEGLSKFNRATSWSTGLPNSSAENEKKKLTGNRSKFAQNARKMNATRAVIGRCPWSIGVDTLMTSRQTCFLCFVKHGARLWKCLRDNFGLSKWKPRKKFSWSCLQVRKTEKPRQEISWRLKNTYTARNPHNSCTHRCERLRRFEYICAITLLWERERLAKRLWETVLTSFLRHLWSLLNRRQLNCSIK